MVDLTDQEERIIGTKIGNIHTVAKTHGVSVIHVIALREKYNHPNLCKKYLPKEKVENPRLQYKTITRDQWIEELKKKP